MKIKTVINMMVVGDRMVKATVPNMKKIIVIEEAVAINVMIIGEILNGMIITGNNFLL